MHYPLYISPLVLSLAISCSPIGYTAQPWLLNKASFFNVQKMFPLILPHQKNIQTSLHGLQYLSQHVDKNDRRHIRFQQYYQGFMVYGGYAILHSPVEMQQLRSVPAAQMKMNGIIYDKLQQDLGDPEPYFADQGALALKHFKKQYLNAQVTAEQVIPLIYMDEHDKAHWAYQVSVHILRTDRIPERPTAIVDAVTYTPFITWDDIKTIRYSYVKGKGYGGNTKVGQHTYGEDLPALNIKRNNTTQICAMENREVIVVDVKNGYKCGIVPLKFPCPDNEDNSDSFWTGELADGYDVINAAYSPTNDALYTGSIIKKMYQDWYSVPVLMRGDEPMQLKMCVHYGKSYENAFWDGAQMTFGDGGMEFFPLVSLGIAAHEISHGFTEQHSDLHYFAQAGGMNESFSDMANKAAEYFAAGQVSNWSIGSEIIKNTDTLDALRYMDQPSKDGVSIDTAKEYYPGINVHFSSGVYNHLFYLLATSESWDVHKAFDIMVKANMDYWTPNSTFNQGACGILNAAQDLGYDTEIIKEHLQTVKIDYADC